MKTITIPIEQYKCLRSHLNQAFEIFNSLEVSGEAPNPGKLSSKEKSQLDMRELILNPRKAGKPTHLKKSK